MQGRTTQSQIRGRTTQSQILSLSNAKSNSSVDRGSEKERGGTTHLEHWGRGGDKEIKLKFGVFVLEKIVCLSLFDQSRLSVKNWILDRNFLTKKLRYLFALPVSIVSELPSSHFYSWLWLCVSRGSGFDFASVLSWTLTLRQFMLWSPWSSPTSGLTRSPMSLFLDSCQSIYQVIKLRYPIVLSVYSWRYQEFCGRSPSSRTSVSGLKRSRLFANRRAGSLVSHSPKAWLLLTIPCMDQSSVYAPQWYNLLHQKVFKTSKFPARLHFLSQQRALAFLQRLQAILSLTKDLPCPIPLSQFAELGPWTLCPLYLLVVIYVPCLELWPLIGIQHSSLWVVMISPNLDMRLGIGVESIATTCKIKSANTPC